MRGQSGTSGAPWSALFMNRAKGHPGIENGGMVSKLVESGPASVYDGRGLLSILSATCETAWLTSLSRSSHQLVFLNKENRGEHAIKSTKLDGPGGGSGSGFGPWERQ